MHFLQLVKQPDGVGEYPYAQAVASLIRAEQARRDAQFSNEMRTGNFFFDTSAPVEEGDDDNNARRRKRRGGIVLLRVSQHSRCVFFR